MLTAILLTAFAATYTVDGVELAKGEAAWLFRARAQYEQELLDIVSKDADADDPVVAKARGELPDLTGAEKAELEAQLATIDTATVERVKLADRDFNKRMKARPTAVDARKNTLRPLFSAARGEFRGSVDANSDGVLQPEEAGLPDFIFAAIDANSDGALAATELATYWSALDGTRK